MNKFVNEARGYANMTTTENGANAYKSTNSALVDLFGVIGSLRDASDYRVTSLFRNAFAENKLLAMKILFYARSIRGGLGERKIFRTILTDLAKNHPTIVEHNLGNIPYFGRWDDLYALVGTPVEDKMWDMIDDQLLTDCKKCAANQPISLAAKWLKSINTSSAESKRLGRLTAEKLGLTERDYRKLLSFLRKHIDVTERKMAANRWDEIVYSNVPSGAMANYRSAFRRHDEDGFNEFISKVKTGEEQINSATLYPYNIFEKMGFGPDYGHYDNEYLYYGFDSPDEVLIEQWKALPDYVQNGANFLVMADTSGSMRGRPACTSVALATYFAERNTGPFANCFMTFSSEPKYVFLKGNSIEDKIRNVPSINDSTNLEKAFDLVLQTAIRSNCKHSEMPKAIIVISDGEIDSYTGQGYFGGRNTDAFSFLGTMKQKFAAYGYELPNIVMWNVASRNDCYLATTQFPGVQFASGQSPSVFKSLIANMGKSAYEAMIETLNDPEYDRVTL